jgi:hypothetical protein
LKTAKLPSASPRNVREVFRVIQRAADDDEFKQGYLHAQGIGQFKQALQLVRFLDLLNSVRTLKADVLAARMDPDRLARLLAERLRGACRQTGCSTDEVGFLAAEDLAPTELDRRLRNLPPIKREKSAVLRSNMVHCLQALHELLHALAQTPANAAVPPIAAPNRPASRAPAPTVRQSLSNLLDLRPKHVEICEVIEEVVDYTPDHTAVKARVHFDAPVEQAHLIRLAKLLLERAGTLAEHQPPGLSPTP